MKIVTQKLDFKAEVEYILKHKIPKVMDDERDQLQKHVGVTSVIYSKPVNTWVKIGNY